MQRLRSIVPDIDDTLAQKQKEVTEELAEAIRNRAPAKKGEYRNSIQAAKLSDIDYRETPGIATTKDPNAYGIKSLYIWRFIEFGTKSHAIKARKKRYLSFFINGRRIVKASVIHPGMKAQPHIFPTYRAMKKKIKRKIAAAVNSAIKGMGHNGGPPLSP